MDEADPNYATIMGYIDKIPAAVLSTVDAEGNPHGAAVYVITTSHATLCFVTKNGTRKYANLVAHPAVSLTFFNEKESSTLQVTGEAYVADNANMQEVVFDKLSKAHAMTSDWLPPITQLQVGEYAIIGVDVTHARLTRFQGLGITGPSVIELKKGT